MTEKTDCHHFQYRILYETLNIIHKDIHTKLLSYIIQTIIIKDKNNISPYITILSKYEILNNNITIWKIQT